MADRPGLVDGLLDELLDDAAALRVGAEGLAAALQRHRARRGTAMESLSGPFLVPDSSVAALRAALLPDDQVRVGLVGSDLAAVAAAREALQDDPWVRVDHVQLYLDPAARSAAGVAALLADLPFTAPTHLLLTPGPGSEAEREGTLDAVLDAVAADGAERVAVEAGAGAGPGTDTLADVVVGCARRRLPLRVTGDLVGAVSDRPPGATGGRPGVLNLLAAAWAALDGGEHEAVAALLASQDPDLLLAVVEPADVRRLRSVLLAVGSGDVDAAAADLARLGLAVGEGPS